MDRKGLILLPGIRAYDETLGLQTRINEARRQDRIPDTVIFLEHHPCITIGAQGDHEGITANRDFLTDQGISVYETDRGGKVTYHGPGQIVCYPIIDLQNYACNVTTYARNLEEIVIRTLHAFGISSGRKRGYPGVWLDDRRKIAAEGISVDRWITMHGVALNVSPAMEHFGLIVPCGLQGCAIVSMAECLGQSVDLPSVMSEMIRHFSWLFDMKLEEISEEKIMELLDHAKTQAT